MWYMDRSLFLIKLHVNSKLSFVKCFLSKVFTSFEVPYEGLIHANRNAVEVLERSVCL